MKKFISGLIIGVMLMTTVAFAAGSQIEVFFQPLKYYFNGVQMAPANAQAGFIYEGTTYVPLRFVAESLGQDVKWDGKTQSIYIGDKENKVTALPSYEDGVYRGIFADRGDIQVSVEFALKDNVVTSISYRQLYHNGIDYRTEKENATVIGIREQHEELINYLVGKDIRVSLQDLYQPGNIVTKDVDTFTGATIRSGKVISATRDALNRGVYRY